MCISWNLVREYLSYGYVLFAAFIVNAEAKFALFDLVMTMT